MAGEAKVHPHQRGRYFARGDVNSLDLWANEASQKGAPAGGKGFVITRKITAVESGKKSGKIGVTFEWQDAKGNLLQNVQLFDETGRPLDVGQDTMGPECSDNCTANILRLPRTLDNGKTVRNVFPLLEATDQQARLEDPSGRYVLNPGARATETGWAVWGGCVVSRLGGYTRMA